MSAIDERTELKTIYYIINNYESLKINSIYINNKITYIRDINRKREE